MTTQLPKPYLIENCSCGHHYIEERDFLAPSHPPTSFFNHLIQPTMGNQLLLMQRKLYLTCPQALTSHMMPSCRKVFILLYHLMITKWIDSSGPGMKVSILTGKHAHVSAKQQVLDRFVGHAHLVNWNVVSNFPSEYIHQLHYFCIQCSNLRLSLHKFCV